MRALVITCSDAAFAGNREDLSGPAVATLLATRGFQLVGVEILPDERAAIAAKISEAADAGVRLIVTVGGTGLAPRDVTPEASADVCERRVEGFGERMRAVGALSTPMAALSRGGAWTRGAALVVNLPGSTAGATQSLAAVVELIPHALELLAGKRVERHPG